MADINSPAYHLAECARAAVKAGFVVLPVKEDGSKAPDLPSWKGYQDKPPTKAEYRSWWPRDGKRTGMGLLMGTVSGHAECLDFDDPGAYDAYVELARATAPELINRLQMEGYCTRTPGGVHLVYRCTEPVSGNQKLAQRPCALPEACSTSSHAARPELQHVHGLIETRGEGGYIVAAPSHGSVHPSGQPYARIGNASDYTVPVFTPEEREVVLGLARALDEVPQGEYTGTPMAVHRASTSPDAPGAQFNADPSTSSVEVLTSHGWARVHQRGGVTYLRRPGKDHGVSATVGHIAPDIARIFTTSTMLEPKSYDRFGLYAVLQHDGDFVQAARTLRQAGYGGVAPTLVASPQAAQQPPAQGAVVPVAQEVAPSAAPPTPPRDVAYNYKSVFGDTHWIGQYVAWASTLNDAAHEYHEALAVTLLATAAPGVRIKLSAWPSGLATNLYVLLIGETTRSRRSTAIGVARSLLADVDAKAVFPDRFSPEAMLEQLSMRAKKPSLWFPEELGQVLEDAVQRPHYQDALLRLYDSPLVYDYARHSKRVKGEATPREDHDRVTDPHWNVIGAATDDVFDGLTTRAVRSGLLPRFAVVWPQVLPPRKGLTRETPAMVEERALLRNYLADLVAWAVAHHGQVEVNISDDAIATIDAYQASTEERAHRLTARLPAAALKVAVISALGEGVPRRPTVVVEQRDAERGVELCSRWEDSARRFGTEIGGWSPREHQHQQRMGKALRYLHQHGSATRSAMMKHMRLPGAALDDLERDLVERGDVEVVQQPTAGRPRKVWQLTGGE